MKIIEKDIIPFQESNFFYPLREKVDYAKLILHATRNLLIEINSSDIQCNSKMKVIIDKMSRLFFYKDKKCFSTSFPFNVLLNEDKTIDEISTMKGNIIENKAISGALAILNDSFFQLNPSLIDYYIESDSLESTGISLLEEIFLSEPAYIRYDNDPANENGKLHPLDHLDINYSGYGTYKIGLQGSIVDTYFENILNIRTNCSYLAV